MLTEAMMAVCRLVVSPPPGHQKPVSTEQPEQLIPPQVQVPP